MDGRVVSAALEWRQVSRYCLHAGDYGVCKIGGAAGWTYEVWKGFAQLQVGLASADAAKAWAQRHHDETTGEIHADAQPAQLLLGH